MDGRLRHACYTGNVPSFLNLITSKDDSILDQRLPSSSNTALHLAARFGHLRLVTEILRLRPHMVEEVNMNLETPLQVACRQGNVEIVEKLMEIDSNLIYMLNKINESGLQLACFAGHSRVVKRLLAMPNLLEVEEEGTNTSLHVAAMRGHLDIVCQILNVQLDFAYRRNSQGQLPIHLASSKGYAEIVREFLTVDSDLCAEKDRDGRTPLQMAVIKGKIDVIREILSANLESTLVLTEQGESLLHLGLKNNQFEVVRFLVENVDVRGIIDLEDSDGNTVLHLATIRNLTTVATYLVNRNNFGVKILSNSGIEPRDFIKSDMKNSVDVDGEKIGEEELTEKPVHVSNSPLLRSLPPQEIDSDHKPDTDDHHRRMLSSRQTNSSRYRRREVKRKEKQRELHMEGLQNARNTITIVAVLIATVTFGAAITPPGGVNQADYGIELKGKSVVGQSTSFKIFIISNEVALFSSLAIVVVLVSIIPFKRRSMMRLLMVTHKAMWVSVSFMAVAYVAAMWIIIPTTRGTQWVTGMVLAVSGGTVGVISVGLGVMALRHWMRKSELRRKSKLRRKKSTKKMLEVPVRKSGSRSLQIKSILPIDSEHVARHWGSLNIPKRSSEDIGSSEDIDSSEDIGDIGGLSFNSDIASSEKSGFHPL